ncbi:MAG: heme o synthase [Ancalomicrobiaceae bacterium]|nr:heme o synthase [Ancalomicrobiaceae bacterium]
MTDVSRADGTIHISTAGPGDFIALLKPRVMSLVVFTALVGMVVAPSVTHPVLKAVALLAIAVGAGAAGALNMWYDADIDRLMRRTASRPIPSGRVSPGEALAFGLVLSTGSVLLLGLAVNWLSAGLLGFTILFYVGIYTMWLKRRTPQNIVIGGAAGAFPPMIGWAAMTNSVSLEAIVLFLIIFMWTPPHFWALALLKSEDYARAGIPMLPVVAGETTTRTQILVYSVVLAPLGVVPLLIGLGGPVYGAVSILMGVAFVGLALTVKLARDQTALRLSCRRLFAFSILYLFALFATLLGERIVHLLIGA